MRNKYRKSIVVPLACLAILLGVSQSSFGQRTVEVPQGAGTLNETISGDTTATGERVDPNTVYILERGGTYITYGSVEHSGYHLTIQAAEGEGARPFIQPGIPPGSDASSRPFRPRGDLTLKGLSVTNLDQLGKLLTRIVRISADSVKIEIEDCWLNQDGQSAFRFDNPGIRLFIKNSVISNIGIPIDPNNGRGIDDRGNDIDSLVIENSTFYNLTSTILRDGGGILNYAKFNQNTVFNLGQRGLDFGEAITTIFTNNLMINTGFYGVDTPVEGSADGVILVDSIGQDLIDDGKTQVVTISNNNFYTDQALLDAQGADIVPAPIFNTAAQAFLDDSGLGDSNIEEDVSFDGAPETPTTIISTFYSTDSINTPDWADKADAFTFSYPDNKTSATASTTDAQLGDLGWTLIETGISALISAVSDASDALDGAEAGGNIGNYSPESITALQAAITAAQTVIDNAEASADDITTALNSLSQAVSDFESSLVTGIDDDVLSDSFSFYPNPGSHFVKVKSSNNIAIGNLELFNSSGQKVLAFSQVRSESLDLDISTLQRGIYLLRIYQNDGKQFFGRIVKNN